MTNVLAINSKPGACDYGLIYDLNALAHNAKVVLSIAKACQFELRAVLKGGYADPNIVRHLSSNERLPLSIGHSVGEFETSAKHADIATLYPGQAAVCPELPCVRRVSEVSLLGIAEALRRYDRPDVMLVLKTSENREGLELSDVPGLIEEITHRFSGRVVIRGFQLNYGCVVEAAPNMAELDAIFERLSDWAILSKLASEPILSLGGSVLLPVLGGISVPSCYLAEIRIGEALTTGTIPGHRSSFELEQTARFNARILQLAGRSPEDLERFVVDVGSQILSEDREAAWHDGQIVESMGSELSVIQRPAGCLRDLNNPIPFVLGYAETERALSRLSNSNSAPFIHWAGSGAAS